jgi:hypothetical protein
LVIPGPGRNIYPNTGRRGSHYAMGAVCTIWAAADSGEESEKSPAGLMQIIIKQINIEQLSRRFIDIWI